MRPFQIFIYVFVLFFSFLSLCQAAPTAKLTAKVIDEKNMSIEGAEVTVSYSKPNPNGLGVADILVTGASDNDGLFVAESPTMNYLGVSAKKEGYYYTDVNYKFESRSYVLNRWEPWNPTVEIVLKKKRNPIAMFATYSDVIIIPKFNTPIGYDLEKGDWVAPYGKGAVSDFLINFYANSRAYTDYECGFTLSFSNELDGIQEYFFDANEQSSYRWPFLAPDNGYVAKIEKEKSNTPEGGLQNNKKKNVNYLFRVRTKTDEDGNIISARYGKLKGEFQFGPNGGLIFSYWFNPSGTRNLEFDPEQNLVKWSSRRDEQKHRIKSP